MSAERRVARQPWALGAGRRLATGTPLEHLDDLVRTVLLTAPGERLHRPGFGAGLGASTLFEPLSPDLAGIVRARAQGSLAEALGDRLEVLEVTVSVEESTVRAEVLYRPRPAGEARRVSLTLPGAGP